MTARQDDVKYLTAHALCLNEIRQVIHISGAKVSGATANVLQHRAMHTFTQHNVDSGSGGSIFRDDRRKQASGDRHDAGNNDLPSLFLTDLPHAADADAQVVKHAFRNGYEFLPGRRDRNAPRAAIEKSDAKYILDTLDSSGQSRLRG